MTKFCDQTKVLEFLSDSGVWVMSHGFWVWVMKIEHWDIKTETPLNQTGPRSFILKTTQPLGFAYKRIAMSII